MAQFVLVNVVVAVLMKHLEESHKAMEDDLEIDNQLEREFQKAQNDRAEQQLCLQLTEGDSILHKRPLAKVSSLPANFTFSTPVFEKKYNLQARRQTVQYMHQAMTLTDSRNATTSLYDPNNSILERGESSHTDLDEADPDEITFDRSTMSLASKKKNLEPKLKNALWKPTFSQASSMEGAAELGGTLKTTKDASKEEVLDKESKISAQVRAKDKESEVLLLPENIDSQFAKFKQQDSSRKPALATRSYSTDSPKPAYLPVPRLSQRSNTNSSKQLFKQAAVEEDPDIDENSLLLPSTSKHLYSIEVKKMSTPSTSIDSSSPTITVIEAAVAKGKTLEAPPAEVKKSESSEILRIISERRRVDLSVASTDDSQPLPSSSGWDEKKDK